MTEIILSANTLSLMRRLTDDLRLLGNCPEGTHSIYADPHKSPHPPKFVFRKDAYIEYEAKDRKWCEYFGIGGWMQDKSQFVVHGFNQKVLKEYLS